MSQILLVDPLTLVGREIAELLPQYSLSDDVSCVHTEADDEHQIGEIAGEPCLISPLNSPDEIENYSVIVVCSGEECPRFKHLEAAIDAHPEIPVIDAVGTEMLRDFTTPSAGILPPDEHPLRLRIAHPCLVAVKTLLDTLPDLAVKRISLAGFEPASAFGRTSIELLARQGAQRVKGETVTDRIGGEIVAFNMIAREPSFLFEEAATLFPNLVSSVSLTLGGCFHGHLVNLDVGIEDGIDEVEIMDVWHLDPNIAISEYPVRLDTVTGSDQIIVTPPMISPQGDSFGVTLMFDGLRIGGATTAIGLIQEILKH